ncbi:LEAF RUST 10 DISEASE-RESISTANCE LOCUS RECEPTOR-LIKE PROTEIN KINASE-like 1.1 [Zea mays]|uniref:LEAF RUST 10 DISEASE-RESISTANCE LOCUS RECEPTOR-LIKE PROTEIN KINASE-like 1.1 n=1 Tax=Zea mays TaxID=4577 RepID=A0A1D6NF29_MAIZE|nr:LEAF RUST 10 DISEASE-RESISTANCE LOCUS RECEPTOR-LIKE PROTEIN KINASE-like 1.1 [Zea mays]
MYIFVLLGLSELRECTYM